MLKVCTTQTMGLLKEISTPSLSKSSKKRRLSERSVKKCAARRPWKSISVTPMRRARLRKRSSRNSLRKNLLGTKKSWKRFIKTQKSVLQ